jgi:hypothetical protein
MYIKLAVLPSDFVHQVPINEDGLRASAYTNQRLRLSFKLLLEKLTEVFTQVHVNECYLDKSTTELVELAIFELNDSKYKVSAYFSVYHYFIAVLIIKNQLKSENQENLIRLQILKVIKENNLEVQPTSRGTD